MHRPILPGILCFTLAAGLFSTAAAQEPSVATSGGAAVATASAAAEGDTPTEQTVREIQAAQAANAAAAVAPSDAADAAVPTAGADLVMWNAAPVATTEIAAQSAQSAKPVSRLRRFASGIISRSSAIASSLTRSAMRFIGVPYVFGGTRTTGFDCSGYVQHVFRMNGVHLPRTADAQFDAGHRIRAKMVPGDLVFFHTYAPGVSHVGIYLGHDKFIHSSSSRGVAVSNLHDRYWAPRYVGAKRVVGS